MPVRDGRPNWVERQTFVVSDDTTGYLYVSPGRKVARGRFQEEKRLLWTSVVKLLDMFGVVSADGDNLEEPSVIRDTRNCWFRTFFPCRTN